MKFGHVFKETLRNEGFPPEWVDSAISYSQLKKCINRLTDELAQVGLNPTTLGTLLKQVEDYNASTEQNDDQDRPFEYIFSGDDSTSLPKEQRKPFHPKLLFYVDEITGEVHSAKLDEDTRSKLQMLAVATGVSQLRVYEEPDQQSIDSKDSIDPPSPPSDLNSVNGIRKRPGYRTVEIPLTSDTEFFAKLTSQLSGLEALQDKEEKRMHAQIEELGKQVAHLTDPDKRPNKKLIPVWRQIFQIYIESGIFFGTTERDHKAHDADKAAQRFLEFSDKITRQGLVEKFKKPESLQALNSFMYVNREILQGLRFGQINHMAMLKILKSKYFLLTSLDQILCVGIISILTCPEFDKQTALGVKSTFPKQIEFPEFSEHLAKAVCAEVNTQVISHVPLIDDYSCPMCMELKWRPVKLRCGHVFCIRCLIVMQTNKQHKCPLCRELTVVDANSGK